MAPDFRRNYHWGKCGTFPMRVWQQPGSSRMVRLVAAFVLSDGDKFVVAQRSVGLKR